MESVYTQLPNLAGTIDMGDSEAESNSVPRHRSSPASPQDSSSHSSEVDQRYSLRPPPRSYSTSPHPSTAFPFPNTFDPDSSLSSKGHMDSLCPRNDHQRVASGGSKVLFRLPDENGMREKPNLQFASASTRQSSSSSRASSLLLPCDHTRYPLEKFRKLEGFVAYDYDLYEDKGPDPDDWLHLPDPDTPNQPFALPWRGIANIGFLAVLLIVIIFLFVGLPIYTTTVRGWAV